MVLRDLFEGGVTNASDLATRVIPSVPLVSRCAACGGRGRTARSARRVADDMQEMRSYWVRVTKGRLQPSITLAQGVDLLRCEMCGSFWRARSVASGAAVADHWRDDRYDTGELARIHERMRGQYTRDARWLHAAGIDAGADVLEIGSYTGALLDHASRKGARAVGVDTGAQTVRFARSVVADATVHFGHFDASRFESSSFDVVAILNCFEQLSAPRAVLNDAWRVLRPGGRIVIRTPNAAFVAHAIGGDPSWRDAACRNLVWGVPFVQCYTPDALRRMLVRVGFSIAAMRTTEFASIAPPELIPSERLRSLAFRVRRPRALGPWIDVIAEAAVRGN